MHAPEVRLQRLLRRNECVVREHVADGAGAEPLRAAEHPVELQARRREQGQQLAGGRIVHAPYGGEERVKPAADAG